MKKKSLTGILVDNTDEPQRYIKYSKEYSNTDLLVMMVFPNTVFSSTVKILPES